MRGDGVPWNLFPRTYTYTFVAFRRAADRSHARHPRDVSFVSSRRISAWNHPLRVGHKSVRWALSFFLSVSLSLSLEFCRACKCKIYEQSFVEAKFRLRFIRAPRVLSWRLLSSSFPFFAFHFSIEGYLKAGEFRCTTMQINTANSNSISSFTEWIRESDNVPHEM